MVVKIRKCDLLAIVVPRKFVKDTFIKVQAKLGAQFLRKHPQQVYRGGEKVWIKDHWKGMDRDYTTLNIVWKGPAEILQPMGVAR